MTEPLKICLSIAGSDPSGGAGIQADLKTFTALGVYGCAAITCLTAQNSCGVESYQEVSGQIISRQIDLVLADLPVTHIKIGMIGSEDGAFAIQKSLKDFCGQIIYDPVLKASDGNSLLRGGGLPVIMEQVLPLATVITPNLPELAALTKQACPDIDAAIKAASLLLADFPNLEACIITGGHFQAIENQLTDTIIINKGAKHSPLIEQVRHLKIKTTNTHGTGCTFSSAYTALHAKSADHRQAFFQSVQFMGQLLTKSAVHNTGKGRGGMVHHLQNS